MKRLKRFFNKKFKRYSFVFLTFITCVVILSIHVCAAPFFGTPIDPYKIFFKKNIDNVFFIDRNDTLCGFTNSDSLIVPSTTVPAEFSYSNSYYFLGNPFVITIRGYTNENIKYKNFYIDLPTYFGWRMSNGVSPPQFYSDIVDHESYALSFHLVFLAASNNTNWAQDSFRPSDKYQFILKFRKNLDVDVLSSYPLEYQYTEVKRDSGTDIYGYFDFYCEIPGSILKGIDSLRIEGASDIFGSPQLQFGFPSSSSGYPYTFDIVKFDAFNAPVYSQVFNDTYVQYRDAEQVLEDGVISDSFTNISLSINRFKSIITQHSNSFKAFTVFVDSFFELPPFSFILTIVFIGTVFIILFRLR